MEEVEVQIGDCNPEDLSEIKEIEDGSFDHPYPSSMFKDLLQNSNGFRVARFGRRIVGYYVMSPSGYERIVIVSLAVHRDFRRMGIGEKLVMDSIALCKNRFSAARKIELQVSVKNRAAQNLYLKCGFRKIGIIQNYYENGDDATLMSIEVPHDSWKSLESSDGR